MPLAQAVIDSNVVVKWFFPEPSRPEALRLLQLYRDARIVLLAPSLLITEVCNVCCKKVRRGSASVSVAETAYRFLQTFCPVLVEERGLMHEAMTLALTSGQSVYDCLYLTLALRRGCDLITADHKFHAAVHATFPSVLRL